MNLFGLTISRTKAVVAPTVVPDSLRGGWSRVLESFAGAWQRNVELRTEDVLTSAPVFACVTLIASDIAKMRIKLVRRDRDGIWDETDNPAYSPVLRDPNHFQNRIQFLEQWVTSKLISGNTYVIKERDNRQVVSRLYVLDPSRVKAMVASDGAVFYSLSTDNLAGVTGDVLVPASEVIHDVMVPLYHPLCGVSPITACGLAAIQGLRVQQSSAAFFGNGSTPSGILTSPGTLDQEEVNAMQKNWHEQFSGPNTGKVAVLGSGLAYTALSMKATDAQLIEQLKWTAENICSAFKVPAYMIGVGPAPSYANVEALSQQYYSQCLQALIESIELLLDRGLGLASDLGTELDLDNLLRMDTPSRVKAAADSIGSGALSPNEARRRYFDLGPVPGGDTPYLQQQNFSLAALAKRDAQADPFGVANPPSLPSPQPEPPQEDETPAEADKLIAALFRKELELAAA
jgi:HK97 family phage portal protein